MSVIPPEQEELARLEYVQARLTEAIRATEARVAHYADDVRTQTAHLSAARADMDHIEKIAARQSIQQAAVSGDNSAARRQRLLRLLRSPYFGRCDFEVDKMPAEAIYIGTHHFHDDTARQTLVYDWRAPIATLFYDYETGAASYTAPNGTVSGTISRKRQLRIRDGRLEFVLESAVNVVDDVLQETLSRATDDGMKSIVATIQRDQNAIIRNEHAQTLIIQGVAGSGKTAIALHRIAFLLYRFRETLRSCDILILSPNRVFADYIGNVLPELGEEAVNESGMEALAAELLDNRYRFETFFEQTSRLLEADDPALQHRIEVKSTLAFVRTLDRYAVEVERSALETRDVQIRRRLLPGWLIAEEYARHPGVAATERVARVVAALEQKVAVQYHFDITPEERRTLRTAVRGMIRRRSLRDLYRDLFVWMDAPELFQAASQRRLEYADVFPLIYLKLKLEGAEARHASVKHLLIDEMQDYSAVQYAVIARLFRCRKTLLGDAQQAVNPHGASNVDSLRELFPEAAVMQLNRSYRSTCEIMRFAQRILPNPALVPVERHGPAPEIVACRSDRDEIDEISRRIEIFEGGAHRTLAIICKTRTQAGRIHLALTRAGHAPRLLSAETGSYGQGVVVCTAYLAKGLEFDEVIVPQADFRTYHREIDRRQLYVACTRAMHRLLLTHVKAVTPCIYATPDIAARCQAEA